MNLAKNQCIKKINKIKLSMDQNPEEIRYIRRSLENMIIYIQTLKRQNPKCSIYDLKELLYSKIKEAITSMSGPTRSDMYLYKTIEYLLKNQDLIFQEIEETDRRKYRQSENKIYAYTSDMERNIKVITENILHIILDKSSNEYRRKFVENSLNNEESIGLKVKVNQALKVFYEIYTKEMKKRYSFKLANTVQMLEKMGFLKNYNDNNNKILDRMGLSVLKYQYESQGNKCGLTDLANPEFVKRFSLEEIIGMTAFYNNRLTKEVIGYNESLYIANKIGIIEEIFETEQYDLKVTDEELRELIAQMTFLTEISKQIIEEHKNTSNRYTHDADDKTILDMEDNEVRKRAIEIYGKDYNELYQNVFLTHLNSDFAEDLNIATILEADQYNLYLTKDFAMESLMVILMNKNKNINWGYIPESKNGRNSIQNKERFVLVGVDMKGYNMPIKLHFERRQLETFLTNYTKDTKLPVYEGNEDMEIPWNGFMTTQILMPLDKEQRKQLKRLELPKLDYRYRFIEHIKWMMFPNRYPDYLCDHQGKKKEKRYVDIVSGRVASSSQVYK